MCLLQNSQKGGDYEEDWINKPPYNWDWTVEATYTANCFCERLAFE